MIHLRSIKLKNSKNNEYPYSIKLIRELKELNFPTPITFFVGENGSGKSTLLEGIAAAAELPTVGSSDINKDLTLTNANQFANNVAQVWSIKTHKGFFLRAEDFFGYVKRINEMHSELESEVKDYTERFEGLARDLTVGAAKGHINELEKRYSRDADAFSHGESFLNLFQKRMVAGGLYLLDEPEAPLSPKRQLSLITLIKEGVKNNCQFIIATHSPFLMAIPDSTIYSFEDDKVLPRNYDEIEHVTLTRDFLNNPERFLRYL